MRITKSHRFNNSQECRGEFATSGQESRKEFDIAKSAEFKSWLRYEAATAALRSQFHHRDIMKMRWVLRYKESGKPEAFGDHWLSCLSRRFRCSDRGTSQSHHVVEEVCFLWPRLTTSSPLKREYVKNAFLQGTPDDSSNGKLAAEPVPELRKALNLREDEIVVLTKACYGLINAPKRWLKSLVRDTQQLGWRSCRHEPCLMTWHVRGKAQGTHVLSR